MVKTSPAPPFVFDSIKSRLGRGVLLCDPERFDEIFGGNAKGRDLSCDLFASETKNVFTEGAAVAFFGQEYEECTIAVRAVDSKSKLGRSPNLSEGWILGTKTGELVLCSVDALLFWDPHEEDEEPQRYVRFSVPPGWYRVTVRSDPDNDIEDRWKDNAEFVLTPSPARPQFSAALFQSDSTEPTSVSASEPQPADEKPDASPTAVDKSLAKAVLSQLTPAAFEVFVSKLFNRDNEEWKYLVKAGNLGDGVFYQPLLDSYGGSLHSVFVLQYLPLKLFKRPQLSLLANDPALTVQLQSIKKRYDGAAGYIGMVSPELVKATQLRSIGFLLNIGDLPRCDYDDTIIPEYTQLVRKVGVQAPMAVVGSYDSFLDFSAVAVHQILSEFLTNRIDGFALQFSPSGCRGRHFSSQTSFESGVLGSNSCPYEPVVSAALESHRELIREFECLIEQDAPEKKLEAFLIDHAQAIFGGRYDRIEPQIWLRFPHFDIAGKERRMDLFMRNSISGDWELFEIKKPIRLIRDFRDGPTMVADVACAITQVKRYARLLSSPEVKEKLKRSGIEYFEPTLNLVIGRRPHISAERWRWLLATHDKDVRLTTFDDLIAEMASRLTDSLRLIGQLRSKS